MAAMDARRRLFTLIDDLAYREGDFVLASGARSKHYFNGKKVLLHPEGSRLFARWILGRLGDLSARPAAIGGLELGAIPIACSVVALADFDLRAFIVRKAAKGHGTQDLVEGDLSAGDRVIVVDDVITTGGSTLQAIEAVERRGCRVERIYCLVDRNEGDDPGFTRYRAILEPCFSLGEFLELRAERVSAEREGRSS